MEKIIQYLAELGFQTNPIDIIAYIAMIILWYASFIKTRRGLHIIRIIGKILLVVYSFKVMILPFIIFNTVGFIIEIINLIRFWALAEIDEKK